MTWADIRKDYNLIGRDIVSEEQFGTIRGEIIAFEEIGGQVSFTAKLLAKQVGDQWKVLKGSDASKIYGIGGMTLSSSVIVEPDTTINFSIPYIGYAHVLPRNDKLPT